MFRWGGDRSRLSGDNTCISQKNVFSINSSAADFFTGCQEYAQKSPLEFPTNAKESVAGIVVDFNVQYLVNMILRKTHSEISLL